MNDYTFAGLMKISIILPVLFVISIFMIAAAFERLWYFFKHGGISNSFLDRLKTLVESSTVQKEKIIELCSSSQGLFANAMRRICETAAESSDRAEKVLKLKRQEARALLGKRIEIFATLSFIAPLLGLLGTVMGVMRAFRDLSVSGAGGPNIVAAGISEALVATIAGIAVAVVAAILNNYFLTQIKKISNTIEIVGQEIILALEPKRRI